MCSESLASKLRGKRRVRKAAELDMLLIATENYHTSEQRSVPEFEMRRISLCARRWYLVSVSLILARSTAILMI